MKVRIPNSGGPSNMAGMLKQAQKMQEDMAALQAELEAREYEISAGGGVVGVKINGKREILNITIEPEIVDPDDVETLSDILVAAVNEVKAKHLAPLLVRALFLEHKGRVVTVGRVTRCGIVDEDTVGDRAFVDVRFLCPSAIQRQHCVIGTR